MINFGLPHVHFHYGIYFRAHLPTSKKPKNFGFRSVSEFECTPVLGILECGNAPSIQYLECGNAWSVGVLRFRFALA